MKTDQPKECVELFHLLFLSFFGKKTERRLYALKGGCNLRFFFNSPRYSEDMDLDVHGIPVHVLNEKVMALLNSKPFRQTLLVGGIEIEHITEHKQSETTQRWKLGLLIPGSDQPIPTKIEFSRRGMQDQTAFESVNPALIHHYRIAPFMCTHYPGEIARLQKIEALSARSVPQARDVFDLHLLQSGMPVQPLQARLSAQQLNTARENILSLSFDHFKSQVLAYLRPDDQLRYDSAGAWEQMQLNLIEQLEPEK